VSGEPTGRTRAELDAEADARPVVPGERARALAARARLAADGGRVVVLVDGRSGSGKTTLARELAAVLDAQLVRLDDVYTGWGGLRSGSDAVAEHVLDPVSPGWRRWDWAADAPADWHPLDPERDLVVEGCGAITRRSAPLASLRVWVELDAATRRERAIARDGVLFERHWDMWARQEDDHAEREGPRGLADVEVAG
jgi:cytidylate kinase